MFKVTSNLRECHQEKNSYARCFRGNPHKLYINRKVILAFRDTCHVIDVLSDPLNFLIILVKQYMRVMKGGYKSHFRSPNFAQIPFSLLFFQILKVPVLLFFCLWFPFPVTKSQSQWPKSHFPSENLPKSHFPFYPFRTLYIYASKYLQKELSLDELVTKLMVQWKLEKCA